MAEIGNAEAAEQILVQHMLTGRDEQAIEFGRRLLDLRDVIGAEAVAGAFIPVGLVVGSMPDKAQMLDPGLPIPAGRAGNPFHQLRPLRPDSPRPPRVTVAEEAGL